MIFGICIALIYIHYFLVVKCLLKTKKERVRARRWKQLWLRIRYMNITFRQFGEACNEVKQALAVLKNIL